MYIKQRKVGILYICLTYYKFVPESGRALTQIYELSLKGKEGITVRCLTMFPSYTFCFQQVW